MTTEAEPFPLHMPDAEAEALRTAYRRAGSILEYGAGGSTVYAAEHCTAAVLSIESDRDWVRRLRRHLKRDGAMRKEVRVRWCDIGPTGAWGHPADTANWGRFWTYPFAPWIEDRGFAPDLVLIDGRFRLGCFAAVLLHARAPLTLLWDDYAGRNAYHLAESILPRRETIGRMARFEVKPQSLDRERLAALVPWFFSAG